MIGLYGLRLGFLLGSHLAPRLVVERAARLFCKPRARRLVPKQAVEPWRETVVNAGVGETRLAAYVWGEPARQPYVLFAHGWSSHGLRIGSWVRPLRDAGYAVVAFDHIAHGRTAGEQATLPDFTRGVLAIGARFGRAAAVIGHSLGGAATALALAQGLPADRAILLAPAADPLDAARRFARFVWMYEPLAYAMSRLFERRLGISLETQQAHRYVAHIGCPALIVHDLHDRDVPWSEGECYARHWPAARLLTTQGLGHHRLVDDPGVIASCLQFLQGRAIGERVVSSPNLPLGLA